MPVLTPKSYVAYRNKDYWIEGTRIIKILPYPIQQAHEYAKTLGKKLEAELRSIVINRLIELKKLRSNASDMIVRPVQFEITSNALSKF